ncbi:MAG: hypothetical protein SFZ24_12495 [Planctomycetota bacterium]|nr:hypothetical protein [Planctomycetota bacterium]
MKTLEERGRVQRGVAKWSAAAACAGVAALLGAGCSRASLSGGAAYPTGRAQAVTENIQVTRRETHITLTNTSARAFGAGTLWLNAQYSRGIDGLAIGETLTLDLREFRNEFGEKFRGGGFFATERPDKLVQAQLELPEEMVGLIVIAEPLR